MNAPGAPQLTFRPLEIKDVADISGIHHRACLIAYRFMNWRYSLDQVERWYSGKFAEWTWTLAALGSDAGIAGFIALVDGHVDQLYVDPAHQRGGAGSSLLGEAIKAVPGGIALDVFEETRRLAPSMRTTDLRRGIAG